jgi:RAC serine/threonine-protein kinase/non-specific serine/threonine protein kinase/protein-serine/threonine kinase
MTEPAADPQEPVSPENDVIHKQGWGKKQGGIVRSWKRRWFVLRGLILHYYVKADGEEKGQVKIKEAKRIERAPESSNQPALKIEIPGRTYFIVYDTFEEVDEWIEIMNKVCFPAYLDE